MELNGLNSNDYIYLKLNRNINNDYYEAKEGEIIGFTRNYLESALYSSIYFEEIDDKLEITRKEKLEDTEVLANQVNESMVFKDDVVIDIHLHSDRDYVLNDWLLEHLKNDDTFFDFDYGKVKITDYNMNNIKKRSKEALAKKTKYPLISVGDSSLRLKLTFKKGETLDFTDPGVMSLFYNPNVVELLASSSAVVGEEKDKCFQEEYKNSFFAADGILQSADAFFRYYRINDDLRIRSWSDLGTYAPAVASYDENGCYRIVYLKEGCYNENMFKRGDIQALEKVATEVPLEEAKIIHEKRLVKEEEDYRRTMQEFHEKEERMQQKLNKKYKEKRFDEEIFPGAAGEFVQTYDGSLNEKKKYNLEEIKEFYKRLKDINEGVLRYMYFYGGTIPYVLSDASSSREFGDVDIFVPIEAMRYVREELQRQPSFEVDFDSISVTSRVNLTSRIPSEQEEDTSDLGVLMVLMDPTADNETLRELFNNNSGRCLQDFGLKGKLFGVNISIFPIYQYNKDLMAKSFNITDMYEYLLAVRVMNNMGINDFAKNVKICGNNLHILPIEYVIISKESAIDHGYQKRAGKDKEDLEFIDKHREELEIDEELKNRLKENYPDYSIAKAYFVGPSEVETISGEKYKELMLLNKGEWLT